VAIELTQIDENEF